MRKPFTGTVLGVLIGVALSVVLARQGIWPMDQLTLFLMPALIGLAAMALLTVGRQSAGNASLVISLVILIPMLVWGALGLAEVGEPGRLDGGCAVTATSAVDDTIVLNTSRSDPFLIDPDGGLEWTATSPTVFTDYEWEIDVVLGGIPVPLDSDTEANEEGDQSNDGVVTNVAEYIEDRGLDADLATGVYEVGGFAATCDGVGFVEIGRDGIDPIAIGAVILAVLLLIVLIVLTFTGREVVTETRTRTVIVEEPPGRG